MSLTFTFEMHTDRDGNEFSCNFESGNKNRYHDLCGDNRYTKNLSRSQPWMENGYSIQEVSANFTLNEV